MYGTSSSSSHPPAYTDGESAEDSISDAVTVRIEIRHGPQSAARVLRCLTLSGGAPTSRAFLNVEVSAARVSGEVSAPHPLPSWNRRGAGHPLWQAGDTAEP